MAWWDKVFDIVGNVADWFDDSDNAQDILGATLQKLLYDAPEMDYDKLIEMAIKQAEIDSPDQYTPTMTSLWEVDPETGKRTQNLAYKPEFQSLLNMLVQRAGSPKDTYRAPTGMTEGLLGARMNTLLRQSGKPEVDHKRFEFPEGIYADFGDIFNSPPSGNAPPPGNTPPPSNNTPPPNTPPANNVPPPVVAQPGGEQGGADQIGSSNGFPNYSGPVGSGGAAGWTNYDILQNGFPTSFPGGGSGPISPNDPFSWLPDELQPLEPGSLEGIEWAERAGLIGRGAGTVVGAATGIPGLGSAGDWIGDMLGENYFNNHVFQSPADIPPTELMRILDAISDPYGDANLPRSPAGGGGGSGGGGGGAGFLPGYGGWDAATRLGD